MAGQHSLGAAAAAEASLLLDFSRGSMHNKSCAKLALAQAQVAHSLELLGRNSSAGQPDEDVHVALRVVQLDLLLDQGPELVHRLGQLSLWHWVHLRRNIINFIRSDGKSCAIPVPERNRNFTTFQHCCIITCCSQLQPHQAASEAVLRSKTPRDQIYLGAGIPHHQASLIWLYLNILKLHQDHARAVGISRRQRPNF